MFTKDSKILIVDDLRLVRKIIADNLAEVGFANVEVAVDGAEAYGKLAMAVEENKPYSLVFCDWNMPVMSGFEFLVKCRGQAEFKTLPIIMVTAESEQGNVLKALKAGATDYLVKPISKELIRKKLERIDEWEEKAKAAG